jgi:putative SOS response-associated peptidase YedK
MCGRFVLLSDLQHVSESFHVRKVDCEYKPARNISPGRNVAAVISRDLQNTLVYFRWGFIPSWAKDPAMGNRMFNARSETIDTKPSFRSAFKKRRCLIVADGFYEWQRAGRTKTPFLISLKSGDPFGFAGLYETWISPERQSIHTCTILTTAPNELIGPIHDRMPVILPKESESIWIDPRNSDRNELLSLLKSYPAGAMRADAVSADHFLPSGPS